MITTITTKTTKTFPSQENKNKQHVFHENNIWANTLLNSQNNFSLIFKIQFIGNFLVTCAYRFYLHSDSVIHSFMTNPFWDGLIVHGVAVPGIVTDSASFICSFNPEAPYRLSFFKKSLRAFNKSILFKVTDFKVAA